jgi:hypothetical protein
MTTSVRELVGKTIVSMVPQWYFADGRRGPLKLEVNGRDAVSFYTLAESESLTAIHSFVQDNIDEWYSELGSGESTVGADLIQELIALHWLRLAEAGVDWIRLLRYMGELSVMTYENQPVSLNLVVARGSGTFSLSDYGAIAPIAASPKVYLRVDREVRFLGYDEILWSQIKESKNYKYCPEFLQPFASILKEGDFSVHLTRRGDLVIVDHIGLLATKRRGKWHLYEPSSLVRGIEKVYRQRGGHEVGRNLFEVLLDLSFKRHGALLVFDPKGCVQAKGILESSAEPTTQALETLLEKTLGEVRVGTRVRTRKKALLLELASLDGAVVFNADRVVAFGAMIRQHGSDRQRGSRTTAAYSARRWGGIPAKVSSDGDVSILFGDREDGQVEASVEFM